MNEVFEVIKRRRSIRKYLPDQIKDEELNMILEAAIFAPSGHNEQPWHFLVIQDKELIDRMSEKAKEAMTRSDIDWIVKIGQNTRRHIFHNAPTVIVVSGRKGSYSALVDCSAATQNMLLAAESLGIGSCWIGLANFFFQQEEEAKRLSIPEGYEPFYAVTLGYKDPSYQPIAPERKRDVFAYIR